MLLKIQSLSDVTLDPEDEGSAISETSGTFRAMTALYLFVCRRAEKYLTSRSQFRT